MVRWGSATLAAVAVGTIAGLGKHGQAQSAQSVGIRLPRYVQSLTAEVRPARATVGQTVNLTLLLTVAPDFHVNANKPDDPNLIPTEVKLLVPKGVAFTVGTPRFPSAETLSVGYSDKPVKVYEGATTITVPVTVKKGAKAGTVALSGDVHLQGCNQTACYPPATLHFSAPLVVSTPEKP